MIKFKHFLIGICFFPGIHSNFLNAQLATIDLADSNQTITGFGGAHSPEWLEEMTLDQIDMAYGNMPGQIGLNIFRVPVPSDSTVFPIEVPAAARAKTHGALLFATPWSPPAYMKTNNNIIKGKLDTAYYDDFASYLDSFANYMAANDAPLYAISLQNEPDYLPTYASCDWSATDFVNFLSKYGDDITSTKVMAAESFQFRHEMTDPILNDSAAESNVDIIGGHIYGGGIADYPLAREKGKEVWMTEHYLNGTSWSVDLATGKVIHDCMLANFNAYVYWYIREETGFMNDAGNIRKRGYVMSQYSKFVRPGYIRVAVTTSAVSNVDVTAYKNDTNVVIVAINRNTAPVDLNIALQNGSEYIFTKFTTSESKNVSNDGVDTTSGSSFTSKLDAQSITTFTTSPDNGPRAGNIAPVANAGTDTTCIDSDANGYELITLDGSTSSDPDDTVTIYTWSLGGKQIAGGMQPQVNVQTGIHNIILTVTDSDGALATDTVVVTVNLPSGTEEAHMWFEAECGTVGSLWNISSNAAASNGKYAVIRPGNNSTASASESSTDHISFAFDVTDTGKYTVWVRCRVPSPDDDSYYVKMDDGAWVMWNQISGGATFQWDYVRNSTENSYNLSSGSHTLTFAYREDGAELDKIYITNTGTVPTGLGDTANNCPPVSGLNLFENDAYDINIYPNPVNNEAIVEFTLEKSEFVNLSIIDLSGRTVAMLFEGTANAGPNSVTYKSNTLESGVYLCRFNAGAYTQTKQIMIIR